MKIKTLMIVGLVILPLYLTAQIQPVQHRLCATNEKEMYRIYEQLLDSTITNRFMSYGIINSFDSKDTLIKIEQYCYWENSSPEMYVCERNRYIVSMSNSMPVAFYERLLNYLKLLGEKNNYFYKQFSTIPLDQIRASLIKHYESGKLTKIQSLKVLKLIELVTLRMVNDGYNFYFLYGSPKYMSDTIRQVLINAIEHPFYPESYLNFYIKNVIDSAYIDTTGIPNDIVKKFQKLGYLPGNELNNMIQLGRFFIYKTKGEKAGISPGQAYLNEKIAEYPMQGYLNINIIVDYVVKRKDMILIPYLQEFRRKHPDYPIKPF